MFLVCWACASRENHFDSWDELVRKRKYLLRWIDEPELKRKAWTAYKKEYQIQDSHLLRTQHAFSFFNSELEELESCEENHLPMRSLFMPPIKI